MLSVIIPSRNERFLDPTVRDVLAKAAGPIEVVVVLDGYWPDPPLPADKRIVQLHFGQARGMRPALNAAAEVANGEYLMKLDAHCMVAESFDVALAADCEEDWVVVPRQYRLDAENWTAKKHDSDYWYLSYPNLDDRGGEGASNDGDRGGRTLHGRRWGQKTKERQDVLIDDLMSAQGSCWFMRKEFFQRLGLFDVENYGTFSNEFQEIGLKAWLFGGRVVINKKTWYAHLHKGRKYGRGWPLGRHDADKAARHTLKWMTDDAWDERQTRPFKWLIEHFWPVPGWPAEWGPEKDDCLASIAEEAGTVAPISANGRGRAYSSHMPVLMDLLSKTDGPVLELGAGRYSTPLIHWACAVKGRHITTLEHSEKYFAYASQFADTWHKVVKVDDWDTYPLDAPDGKRWSLAFVDHEGPRRGTETKRLADLADLIICHDTCGRDERKYGYKDAWPAFKYRQQFQLARPRTSVVSNFIDVAQLGLP